MQFAMMLTEVLCYTGAVLSAVIAWRLSTMENLTWINKMFLAYFSFDCIFGIVETYLLFKLNRER